MSFADLIAKKSGSGEDEYPESGLPEPARAGSTGGLEAFIQRHGHVTEEYSFYGGEVTLRFNIDEWKYYRVARLGNLEPVNGVTNVVGIIDKSHMLTPWAAKMAIQKLLRIMPTEMVDGIIRIKPLTFEEFTVIALEAKGAHKEKLDEASDIGHIAHKCLEESIRYAMANDQDKIVRKLINIPTDEQAATAASGGFNWMQRHNVRWRETESKIHSREHNYAGTMDGLAVCDSCDDRACCPVAFKDRLSLIDWKSSNHLKIEYLFQTAAYKHAKMEEFPDLHILDTWILRLGKSEEEAGKFEPWHMTPDEYEEDFKGYLACLNLTRLVDSVEERMKTQKGSIRAIRKEQKETAKALAKEQEKLQKALDKASAKKAKEEEKVRIKTEAKAERERLKAEKKMGVTHRVEVDWAVNPAVLVTIAGSIPAAPTITDQQVLMCNVPVEDLPEGIQPRADDVVFIGGTPCTSIEKPTVEPQCQTYSTPCMKSVTTTNTSSTTTTEDVTPITNSKPNQTTAPVEMPQPVAIILTEAQAQPLLTEEVKAILEPAKVKRPANAVVYEEEFVNPFKLPME